MARIDSYFQNKAVLIAIDEYLFYLGNEGTTDRPWLGEYHLVAIYNRALSDQEILQNFKASMRSGN